jgi:hypothetical protein
MTLLELIDRNSFGLFLLSIVGLISATTIVVEYIRSRK